MDSPFTKTHKIQQQQLLNVVEEMAIAAGLPVPPVYLIPENSINAFAAGYGQDDAVIGINQGTLDLLNREELQGVVAHEFSHILNGDMRINIRLMALLSGILFIGIIGYGMLRGSMFSRSKDRGQAVALAFGLIVVGYGGTFFGNLIKAAVSRQRGIFSRCICRTIHAHQQRHCQCVEENRRSRQRLTNTSQSRRRVQSHVFWRDQILQPNDGNSPATGTAHQGAAAPMAGVFCRVRYELNARGGNGFCRRQRRSTEQP